MEDFQTPLNLESVPQQNPLVNEFFISETRKWDATKLRSLLEDDDVNDILSIRPSITNGHDILHLTYSSNGVYSVKTRYHSQRILDSSQNQISQVPAFPTLVFKNKISAKI